MTQIRENCTYTENNYWDPLPTDFGLYRVIVKGKFVQNQLNI